MTQAWPKDIYLTPSELSFVLTLAAQRLACKPEHDRFKASRISEFGSHYLGVMGELVAAKVFGAKVDQSISASGDKHRQDLRTKDGRRLEIKTISFSGKDPMLKLNADEIIDGTEYVLAQIQWPDGLRLFPPVSVDVIRRVGETRDFGYGPRRVLTASQILGAVR